MLDDSQLSGLVSACTYKPGWRLNFNASHGNRPAYIQWEVDGLDSSTGKPTQWKSGKRHLSPHMCKQEVVAAVFSLALQAEEHECREWFRYRGSCIYNPHLCPDALAELASKKSSFNIRQNAMHPE